MLDERVPGLCEIGGSHKSHAFFAVPQTVPVLLRRCFICSASNGSCVAPPKRATRNRKPCILGRAGMSNPALFWDVYRYFYGVRTHACQNRRHFLEQYCLYLEKTFYQRWCCDDEEWMATTIQATPVCSSMSGVLQRMPRHVRQWQGREERMQSDGTNITCEVSKIKILFLRESIDHSLKPVLCIFSLVYERARHFCVRANRWTNL
jgi:hypothetical protein